MKSEESSINFPWPFKFLLRRHPVSNIPERSTVTEWCVFCFFNGIQNLAVTELWLIDFNGRTFKNVAKHLSGTPRGGFMKIIRAKQGRGFIHGLERFASLQRQRHPRNSCRLIFQNFNQN
jgi:hypothetical protein